MKKTLLALLFPIYGYSQNIGLETRLTMDYAGGGLSYKHDIEAFQVGAYQFFGLRNYTGILAGYNFINAQNFKLGVVSRVEYDFFNKQFNYTLPCIQSTVMGTSKFRYDITVGADINGILLIGGGLYVNLNYGN